MLLSRSNVSRSRSWLYRRWSAKERNCAKRKTDVTTQTRYIVSVDLKPAEAAPHIFKWTVVAVRQAGATEAGEPIYEPAGATSEERTFTWTGIGLPTTATPPPNP